MSKHAQGYLLHTHRYGMRINMRHITQIGTRCLLKLAPFKTFSESSKSHIVDFLVVWNIWIIFPYLGNFIIPTDFHSMIFQRGRSTTNQVGYIPFNIPPGPGRWASAAMPLRRFLLFGWLGGNGNAGWIHCFWICDPILVIGCHGQKHIQKWERQCFWNSQRVDILMGCCFLLMIGCHGQSWIATLWLVKHG